MQRHIFIEAIAPSIDHGLYAVKRCVGDTFEVSADIFRDGHEKIAAQLRLRDVHARGDADAPRISVIPLVHRDNDRYVGSAPLTKVTEMAFCIDAWTDVYSTWLLELGKKVEALLAVPTELAEGALLLGEAAAQASADERTQIEAVRTALAAAAGDGPTSYSLMAQPHVRALMHRNLPRHDLVSSPQLPLSVDRRRAAFGSWYELFVRSAGREVGQHATFATAQPRLAEVAAMGFDVIYLAPIHPIGIAHRKGPNNALVAGPNDPGCPWAIGNAHGGHDAIEPALGTLADFKNFVTAAHAAGLELALDFAIQCSPDHPWVKDHPEWFYHRPDGSIKYAENPPKKYEDVYPVNFDTVDKDALWAALLDILLFWVGYGVKIFRVDNPHTKPFAFWQWAMAAVRRKHPDVIFLAEAFTRPKVMQLLAKVGFSQSYTYFTWRNTAAELREYLTELSTPPQHDYFRPNFFVNTPDILPEILVTGGRAAFIMRAILAATMAPTYGIYSGFELCENAVLPGKEEYLNSEKYEVRTRDWHAPGNINALLTKINSIRRAHPALQRLDNITFLNVDNPNLLAYAKTAGDDIMLIVVNVDPHAPHHGTVEVPHTLVGIEPWARFEVVDELDGATYNWGTHNYVRLVPEHQPAHLLQLTRRLV